MNIYSRGTVANKFIGEKLLDFGQNEKSSRKPHENIYQIKQDESSERAVENDDMTRISHKKCERQLWKFYLIWV